VGAVIVLLVVAFPQGIAGFARTLFESRRVRRAGSAVAQRAS
jgi:hypothetical protein